MAGAAVLAARAALRAGSGLVTVATDASLAAAVTSAVPEATLILLPSRATPETRDDEAFAHGVAAALGSDLGARFDAVAIGPGLGTSDGSRAVLAAVLDRCPWTAQVFDADALNLIAAGFEPSANERRVWTPHPGEFQRLTGDMPHGDADRVDACTRFVARRGGTIVLKGYRTVVAHGEEYAINITGNPGMATGGSGDVLTGLVASFLGQGYTAFDSARLAVYLHGLAGDLAARDRVEASIVAGDLVEFLPAAMRNLAASTRTLPTPK